MQCYITTKKIDHSRKGVQSLERVGSIFFGPGTRTRTRFIKLFWTRTRLIKIFGPGTGLGPDLLNIFGPGPGEIKILELGAGPDRVRVYPTGSNSRTNTNEIAVIARIK